MNSQNGFILLEMIGSNQHVKLSKLMTVNGFDCVTTSHVYAAAAADVLSVAESNNASIFNHFQIDSSLELFVLYAKCSHDK